MKPIVAVIVLYKMTLEESPTYSALAAIFRANCALAEAIRLIVADNSPEPQTPPPSFDGTYIHDPTNPGLARRYNQALELAAANGARWLLLFDQDTKPTSTYFEEIVVLSKQLEQQAGIDIVVPKLVMNGRILSPHAPVFRKPLYAVTLESSGVIGKDLRAFNSGALVRISALKAIGGFPKYYWLDYLDHATFHRIQQNGGSMHVMQSVLEHELSDATSDRPVNPVRLLNRLKAEERFYAEHGTRAERRRHRFDLLRQILGWGRRGHFEQARLRWKALLHLD